MINRSLLASAALVASTTAQVATYQSSGYGISVNVPSDTASSGNGAIYMQISAPSGTQWVGFGQGTGMSGSNMMVVYAADSSNVTISPRLGTGHNQPNFNSDAQVTLLEGSGIGSDGSLVANIRCDSCLSWSGGSMSATDTSSNWIFAYRTGDSIDSTDQSESITQHNHDETFNMDLTQGTGGSSSNPFVAASDNSGSGSGSSSSAAAPSATDGSSPSQTQGSPQTATETGSATTTQTGGVSVPLASSQPASSSGSSQSSGGSSDSTRIAHATIMSLVFVVMFPLAALTLYIPYHNKVRHIHAPLQILTIILMIVGLGLGIKLGNSTELDGYHQVIGYVVVAWMVLFQPVLGLLQHLHFRKQGNRSAYGHGHRWLGRAMILLGVVNGGLGFMISGSVGSEEVPTYAVAVYSVFAVLIFLVYLAVVFWPRRAARNDSQHLLAGEKGRPKQQDYEMHGRGQRL